MPIFECKQMQLNTMCAREVVKDFSGIFVLIRIHILRREQPLKRPFKKYKKPFKWLYTAKCAKSRNQYTDYRNMHKSHIIATNSTNKKISVNEVVR